MNKIDISIIIVNYKSKKELFDCIKSIETSNTKATYEIIVVDNDGEKRFEKELKKMFESVKYIKSPTNIGYGAGNNLGAKFARGKYLFFLNPDTRTYPEAIDELFRFISRDNEIGIVAPLLFDKNNNPYPLQGTRFLTPIRAIFSLSFINKLIPANRIYKDYYLIGWDKKNIKEVDVVPGTAFMIKKEIFKKINGFDENFFLFFEEFDLCKRVRELEYKIFITPKARIIHKWGVSSSRSRQDIKKIFSNSRFYYFKKHFGLFSAILTETFLRIDKHIVLLICALTIGFFLRIYKLSETMSFIGDQGWFYLSAKDMVLTGKIPLVGITSSHTWLHQGPYWTYILALIFKIFGFNPLIPGYFTAVVGSLSIFIIYKIVKKMFEKNTAIVSSFLYAISPLIIINERFPYHTTLIPLFTILFIYSLFKWVKGEVIYFIWVIMLIGILYNFELATFSLAGVLLVFFLSGLAWKRKWALNIINKKILSLIVVGIIFTMLPVIIHDIKNGFLQTFGYFAWVSLKLINSVPGLISATDMPNGEIFVFLFNEYRKIIFPINQPIALLFLFSTFLYLIYRAIAKKNISEIIIIFLFLITVLAFLINKIPSQAYLPVFFPVVIIISAIFLQYLIKKFKVIGVLLMVILIFTNIYYFLNKINSGSPEFLIRRNATEKIYQLTSGNAYNLIGKGTGSQFDSFTMNYEYLLWYYYKSEPSKNDENLKIYIEENNNKILVNKND
ncbi:MAG: glycosyltransferase [Candidatus Levybacteria bacterium]|nr:glycosyltransferase [Candidatus Levybacteria bacterium]